MTGMVDVYRLASATRGKRDREKAVLYQLFFNKQICRNGTAPACLT
jgi:hypothetical protein